MMNCRIVTAITCFLWSFHILIGSANRAGSPMPMPASLQQKRPVLHTSNICTRLEDQLTTERNGNSLSLDAIVTWRAFTCYNMHVYVMKNSESLRSSQDEPVGVIKNEMASEKSSRAVKLSKLSKIESKTTLPDINTYDELIKPQAQRPPLFQPFEAEQALESLAVLTLKESLTTANQLIQKSEEIIVLQPIRNNQNGRERRSVSVQHNDNMLLNDRQRSLSLPSLVK